MLFDMLPVGQNCGTKLWSKTYGETLDVSVRHVFKTKAGNFLAVGKIGPSSNWALLIAGDGSLIWEKEWNKSGDKEVLVGGTELAGGGFVFIGTTTGSGFFNSQISLFGVNSSGLVVWDKKYGETGKWAGGASIIELSNGGLAMLGFRSTGATNDPDEWLVRLDNKGDSLWSKEFEVGHWEFGLEIQETSDGGFLLMGYSSAESSPKIPELIRTDGLGKPQWSLPITTTSYSNPPV